jgi:hypothetical protein
MGDGRWEIDYLALLNWGMIRPHPARSSGSGSPLSCRFFIRGEPPNKNAAPKLGRGAGGEG